MKSVVRSDNVATQEEIRRLRDEAEWHKAFLNNVTTFTETSLAYLDRDFNFVWVNSAYADQSGYTREELIGRNHFELFPGAEAQAIFERVRDTGEPYKVNERPFEYPNQPGRGVTYWNWTLAPIRDDQGTTLGLVLSLVDVTEAVKAREEMEKLRAEAERRADELENATQALRESHRTLEALMEYIPEAVTIVDAPDARVKMRSRFAEQLSGRPTDRLVGESIAENLGIWGLLHSDGLTQPTADEIPLIRALRYGTVVQDEEWIVVRPTGEKVPITVSAGPIKEDEGKIVGAVATWRDARAQREARQVLQSAYERERHIADVLQRAMTPEIETEFEQFGIVGRYQPALEEAEVGGDFYDVFTLPDAKLGLVMGDVSGKGLSAAVYTAMARYMLRAYAHEDPQPEQVLRRLNEALCDYTQEEHFITVLYGVLYPAHRTFTYANAGHDEPLLFKAGLEQPVLLDVTGPAAGVLRDGRYSQRTLRLDPGDVLLVYTDGIPDARSHGRFFGIEGVSEVLLSYASRPQSEIASAVFDAASRAAEGKLRDDAAVLVIKRLARGS